MSQELNSSQETIPYDVNDEILSPREEALRVAVMSRLQKSIDAIVTRVDTLTEKVDQINKEERNILKEKERKSGARRNLHRVIPFFIILRTWPLLYFVDVKRMSEARRKTAPRSQRVGRFGKRDALGKQGIQ